MGNIINEADLAVEGLPTDQRVLTVILPLAEEVLERATGYRFYAHDTTYVLDGTDGPLVLPQPLITLSTFTLDDEEVDAASYIIRNRRPPDVDDRLYPRIERLSTAATWGEGWSSIGGSPGWGSGVGNISVTGTFGFTDLRNGAEKPPHEIIRLCVRLVAYELARVGDLDAQMARKLQIYGSSFEGISLASSLAAADRPEGFAVPEIDQVIARFSHPAKASRPKFAFGGA